MNIVKKNESSYTVTASYIFGGKVSKEAPFPSTLG